MTSPFCLKENIEARLKKVFSPRVIEVLDESYLHLGHKGAPSRGQSHFAVTLEAPCLEGLSRVEQHQQIYKALEDFWGAGGIHALRITCFPGKM